MSNSKTLKILSFSFIYIISILYFTYASYISLSSLTAQIYLNEVSLITASKTSFNLFLIYTYEYLIYSLLMLINYLFYKHKCIKTLFIINSIILIIIKKSI